MAGKGVTVCDTVEEAERAIAELAAGARGEPCQSRRLGRHRGAADRPGGEPHRPVRRQDGGPAADGPRSQATARRRPWSEHRRDGCLQPAPGALGRGRTGAAGALPPADPGRAGPARHPVPWRALRGPDAHRRTARSCSSATRASATPRPRPSCRGLPSRSVRSSWPRRAATSRRRSARPGCPADACRSSRARPSRSCWPPRATRPRRRRATRSRDSTRPQRRERSSSTRGPRETRTAPFGRQAAGSCRSSVAVTTWRPQPRRPSAAADLIHAPGLQRRHDIGAGDGAASGGARHAVPAGAPAR